MFTLGIDRFGAAIGSLPWLVHIPIALAFIAGIVLWMAGRKVLRPTTITLGLALGAFLGFLLLPAITPTISISPYLGLVGGSVCGLILGLMLYKIAMAMTFGSAMGAGFGMVASVVLGTSLSIPAAIALQDPDTGIGGGEQRVIIPPPPALDPRYFPPHPRDLGPAPNDVDNPGSFPAPLRKPAPNAKSPSRTTAPKALPNTRSTKPAPQRTVKPAPKEQTPFVPIIHDELPDDVVAPGEEPISPRDDGFTSNDDSPAARVGTFWWIARDTWAEWWTFVPGSKRAIILGAAGAGLLIGTLLGFLLPAWAAGASTALVGSAVWMPSGLWLAKGLGIPGLATLNLPVGTWIIIWVVVALIGVAIQWYALFPADLIPAAEDAGAVAKAAKKVKKKA